MLYSVIPPILVILSLAGIIVFLVKKAPAVSRLGEENFGSGSAIDLREPGFLQRGARKIKETDWKAGKNVLLGILEKVMKALRFVFLKLGVFFSKGWVSIKNRRKEGQSEAKVNISPSIQPADKIKLIKEELARPENPPAETEDDPIIAKIRSYVPEKKIVIKKEPAKPEQESKPVYVEPMISKNVVRPKTEMKDRLEELLIERIAANPKDIEAYQRLGQYYMEIENYEYAKECFKQIVKLSPEDRNAKYTLKKLERLI